MGNILSSSALRHAIILDRMHQPLAQAFPEYSVVKRPQGIYEFRVETKSCLRSRNASAPRCARLLDCALVLILPILGAVAWQVVCMPLVCPRDFPLKLSSGSSLGLDALLSGALNPVWILESNTSALG